MKIGDKVRVSNVNLETYGLIGRVDGYGHQPDLIRVQVDGQAWIYSVNTLQLIIDAKKKDVYHVAIINCIDGKIDMDFSNSPSIETMEHEFNLACDGEVVIGFLDDIKEDIIDRLKSWDNVVGLIDNKPFKASRSLVFEGVDL